VGSEERRIRGEPFLILLDSMDGNKENAVTIIRQYLAAEWKVINARVADPHSVGSVDPDPGGQK
jgi:hypothetical protein